MKPKAIHFDDVFEKHWHKYLMGLTEKQKEHLVNSGDTTPISPVACPRLPNYVLCPPNGPNGPPNGLMIW
jgi:hypothetical protein